MVLRLMKVLIAFAVPLVSSCRSGLQIIRVPVEEKEYDWRTYNVTSGSRFMGLKEIGVLVEHSIDMPTGDALTKQAVEQIVAAGGSTGVRFSGKSDADDRLHLYLSEERSGPVIRMELERTVYLAHQPQRLTIVPVWDTVGFLDSWLDFPGRLSTLLNFFCVPDEGPD